MNSFKAPPFWFLLATLAQFGIAWYARMPPYSEARSILGYIIIGFGVVLVLTTRRSFRNWKTPICPFGEPKRMIKDGPFYFSRNPLYLGEVVMLVGFAFLHGAWQTFIPVPILVLVIDLIFIRQKERVLREKYGDAFETYAANVRKWI